MNFPLVSVIITTKNEEKNIANCLKSILRQTYPCDKIEIIVVDNDSTDRTKEISQKYTNNVFDKGPERSAQRNFGAKQAKGEYYLYLDADMTLSPNVISECVGKFENCLPRREPEALFRGKLEIRNCQLVGLYIPEIVMGNSFWSKVRRFERGFYNATVIDAVRIIRLKDFIAVNGFNENMIAAEDWDLTKRLKKLGDFDIIKSPIYHNEADFDLRSYLEKKAYYSRDIKNYLKRWPKNDPDIKKQFSLYYRFFGVFIENGKWKKLILHPALTLGMFWLKFSVGLVYLLRK